MLSILKFLAKASRQLIEERFTIVGDDMTRHAISVDDVCPDDVNNVFLLDFF